MTTSRMLGALLTLVAAPLAAQDTAHVVIVATTDIHGHATGWDFIENRAFGGGLTRAATVVDSLRARYPGQVVLVDAGDLLAGDPFAAYWHDHDRPTHPLMEAVDALEYDAIVPGNHEFNYGFDFFKRVYTGRNFRPVCANCLVPTAEGTDSLMFAPFITVIRGGVRVSIGGLTTPGSMVWDGEKLRGKLKIRPVGDRSSMFATMRATSDLVVTLIHSGMDGVASYDTTGIGDENVAATLAAGSSRPDVVIVGHSHREMADSVINGVHFTQPRNFAQSVSVTHVTLRRAGTGWRVAGVRSELVQLANQPENPRLGRRMEPLAAPVKQWANEWIGFTTGPFDANAAQAGASPLVTWMGEVMRRTAHADLAATPIFNRRRGLPDGDVHRSDVFAIYPYENTLKAIKISGAQLRAFLEFSARYYGLTPDGHLGTDPRIPSFNFDMVVGADYDLDLTRPVGSRVTRLEYRGRAIAPTDSFTLAINNYRQAGGGGYTMLQGARVVYDQGENVRDLLEASVVRDTLRPASYARINWRILPQALEDQARAFGGAPARPRPSAPRDTTLFRILATNDLHGQIDPRVWNWSSDRAVGGVAYVKSAEDSLAAQCGCPVLRIDAGDEFQGTLPSNTVFGRSVVEAFNRIGLQAATTGNHDFDWGIDTLRHRVAESRYPWLAANLVDSASGTRPDWLKGWVMLQAGTRKVAVIGYAHPHTPLMTFKAAVAGLKFLGGPAPIVAAATEARNAGADFIVLLAHYGDECSTTCGGDLFALADSLPAGTVDVVLGGHAHGSVFGTARSGMPVLSAGSSGRAIAHVDVVKTVVGAREIHVGLDTVWNDRYAPDRGVDSLLARYRLMTDSLAHRRVATIDLPMARHGREYTLGRLIADAYRVAYRTDFAMINNGGIRRDILAGPLDYGTAFELSPFGNRLIKITLPGRGVKEFFEAMLDQGGPDGHISGAIVKYDSAAPQGRRIREVRLLDGHKIDDGHQYTLTVADFIAQGQGRYAMLARYPQDPIGMADLDAIVAYLRRLPQPVRGPEDVRFVNTH